MEYEESQSTSYLEVNFTSDRAGAGTGFSCSVSCVETAPPPTSPPNPALSVAWQGCRCGLANMLSKIVGGQETLQHQFPWQVGLTGPRSRRPFCGGSILTSRTVLTAAHCVRWKEVGEVVVVAGDHDHQAGEGEVRQAVCGVRLHPAYNSLDNNHDLALLTLCQPLQWRMEVQPVCLPPPDLTPPGLSATVTGWGSLHSGGPQPDKLQAVNVTSIANTECDQVGTVLLQYTLSLSLSLSLSDICCNTAPLLQAYGGGGVITESMLCARAPGRDACQGDSGGPLVLQSREPRAHFTQIGVVSWGQGCADHRYPGVYTRLADHLGFINNNLQGELCQAP